ncbi:MAG: hypothetical protein Aurels2KO_31760 [Aureliella sp.]
MSLNNCITKTLGCLTIMACALGSTSKQADAQEIRWLKSAEQAALQAEKTGKPILVYVRSESCHYCDKLQHDVWEFPQAASYVAKKYIPLKLSKELNPAAVESLKIKGYPTTLVFSPQREFVAKVEGYMPAGALFAKISQSESTTAAVR